MLPRLPWWAPVLATLALTAILHHSLFFRPQCLLNPFDVQDYTLTAFRRWLAADPSLPWALTGVSLALLWRPRWPWLGVALTTFGLAFVPLTVWIWDLPGTGRWVCTVAHDGRLGLYSRHLYLLGMVLWLGLLWGVRRTTALQGNSRPPAQARAGRG